MFICEHITINEDCCLHFNLHYIFPYSLYLPFRYTEMNFPLPTLGLPQKANGSLEQVVTFVSHGFSTDPSVRLKLGRHIQVDS